MGKTSSQKTNAARLLDRAGIAYELVPYTVDETNLAADHVAAELDEPIEQVFMATARVISCASWPATVR